MKPSLDASGKPDLDIDLAVYGEFSDLMEFVATPGNFERHKTVVIDSDSHLMSIGLSSEIEDQALEERSEKKRQDKSLVSPAEMSLEGYGGLYSWMFRLTAAPEYAARKNTATEDLLFLADKAKAELDWIEQTVPPKNDAEYHAWQDQKLKFASEIRKLISAVGDIGFKLFQVQKVDES